LAELTEVLADQDDALLEKLLEDVTPTSDELFQHLRKDQASGAIVEVLFGAAGRGNGVTRLWKALRHDAPAAWETAARRGVPPGDEPLVQVFKTVQAGKLSYARIWRGVLRDGATLDGVRVGGVTRYVGGEAARTPEAAAGELVALGRLEGVSTGAVLGAEGAPLAPPFPEPPAPVYWLAIATKDRKDDVKLSAALHKLVEEDPSLRVEHDVETGDTLLEGQGEIHLNAALERLASGYNIQIAASAPKIAYKETIKRTVSQHSRLKRQTGGHGQFADVKLEIAPRGRGEGFLFIDRVVGGAVPKQYIPAVRDAAEEAMQKGPFGYPVVDVSVALVDGSFHAVDSSDMAFKTATRLAIVEGLAKADPALLEPIDHVTASAPNVFTAATQRLLTGRRGQILGYAERPGWPGWDDIEALVPAAELHDFIIKLRSDTMGLGTYQRRFDHLAEAHAQLADRRAAR
jgi:elongation factor G